MLRNVKDSWWRSMVQRRHDVVGLDASILSPPAVWEASGHLANFTDPLVDCKECKERFRLDKLDDPGDRKSTRLNSKSLMRISYAVFCLKKKKKKKQQKI